MIHSELTTLISRPAAEVFAYVSDFTTLPEYDAYVETARQTSEGPVGLGTTWTHTRTQGRRHIEAPIEMIEFEPNRRFKMKSGSGPFDVRSTMTFEAQGANETRVVEVLEMRLSGPLRLLEPIIRRQVGKQGAAVHARLKEVIEKKAAV